MPAWKGIIGRGFRPQEFKEYVGTLTFTDWRPQFAVVHNTSLPRFSQWHSTPGEQRMRNLESFYRDEQHWSAGPHLFVADDLIWVFTPLTTSGVHSPSWNAISWGLEMVGEYEEESFSPAVRENTVDALAVLHACRGLNPDTIRFHKEDPRTTHTTCPGRNVDKADLIHRVHDRMMDNAGGGGGEHRPDWPDRPCGDAPEVGHLLQAMAGTLKSTLMAGNPTLGDVAAGYDVIVAGSGREKEIGLIQDAINLLAAGNAALTSIDLGPRRFRGSFGPLTKAAVESFQKFAGIEVDGRVGKDSILALDAALVSATAGGSKPADGAEQPKPVPAAVEKPAVGQMTATGKFDKTLAKVFNRGTPNPSFLQELIAWGKTAPEVIFADQPGNNKDVYAAVTDELGPFGDILHRKACLLELMRVLAGFESSWGWTEGIDPSRDSEDTSANSEAGAWQVSFDSLQFGEDLKDLAASEVKPLNGVTFQSAMKANHPLAMEYIARLMRHTRMHNGPLYKGSERGKFPLKLQGPEQSIYPWLSRGAVAEFQEFLA